MKKWLCAIMAMALLVSLSVAVADEDDKKKSSAADKRAKIDAVAKEALDTLLEKSDSASKNYAKAYGYAVFDNLKIAFGISGGGGSGVAVVKDSGTRTYMKMGTGGVGLGLGGQKYQVVFFFETEKAFTSFVE
jgi:lipid-binding SYLF domain-containing protein